MNERLISFETAKLAHEKGFKPRSFFGYITKFYHARTKSILAYGRTGRCDIEKLYYASTKTELQDWLREEHNVIVWVEPEYYDEMYFKGNVWYTDGSGESISEETWPEALESALKDALNSKHFNYERSNNNNRNK